MDLVRLACPFLRAFPVEYAMGWFSLLGNGFLAGGVGVALLAYGVVGRNRRLGQAGLAAALAVLAAGLVANLLKVILQLSRPNPGEGFGFPSGHAATAFALAGALGQGFPAAAPFLSLLALLVGVARLYSRSHFVIDVVAGGLLGGGTGALLARHLCGPRGEGPRGGGVRWGWALPAVAAVLAFGFFTLYERSLAPHPSPGPPSPADSPGGVLVRFGTPEARSLLLGGWSGDEPGGIWVEGVQAQMRLALLRVADHRLRLTVQPYVRPGGRPTCQVMAVTVNGEVAARLLVEKGWRRYEVKLPRQLLRTGPNELGFRLSYAESPSADGIGGDPRFLSVAFASLEAFPD